MAAKDAPVIERMKELSAQYPRYGYRRIHIFLGRDGYCIIPDRAQAIELALRSARSGDAVLIAGKGHEDYQIIGTDKRPFDDRVEARRALEALR